ncbi:hypothetical protein QYE76_036048 [Lolium multiflorum]|uniref:DUF3615 domain-containing protein n=1 Tax=Lolium multiflorum TaxID=4521 RepID=A0AAD8R090_LOLMU|nr:uncharacterized protein LOC124700821 [Lolium rigidum]KAK1612375.1 hypothetical protein QYE76_036048 [Lolium multiflorum]
MFPTTTSTTPEYFVGRFDTRLETWQDPTPRKSETTFEEFREACIKAARRNHSLMDARSSVRLSEEQLRQREEQDHKFLMIALEVYTKKNNMQPTELEFVEVKGRNLIDEFGLGYLHFNFLVKGLDGKNTMFFAEVHHDLEDENDVYLCKPLEEEDMKPSKKNDEALCKGCEYGAKDLIHPSCGSFRGGHKDVCPMQSDSDDDECDYEWPLLDWM